MIGAIAGDIIGSVYEWKNIKTKRFELFNPACSLTDDSVFTVALADAIGLYDRVLQKRGIVAPVHTPPGGSQSGKGDTRKDEVSGPIIGNATAQIKIRPEFLEFKSHFGMGPQFLLLRDV